MTNEYLILKNNVIVTFYATLNYRIIGLTPNTYLNAVILRVDVTAYVHRRTELSC